MISTYAPLPLPTGSAPDSAPPAGPDTPRDLDAPSFQSRLDQQNDLRRAHSSADALPRTQSVTRHDEEDQDDQDAHDNAATHTSPAAASTSTPSKDSVTAAHGDDNEDDKKAKTKRAARQNAQGTAATLPFTPATLALAGGIAPLPAPATPVSASAPADHNAAPEPVLAAPALPTASPIALQVTAAQPTAAPAAASTLLPLLNSPGVSMDSNAANKNAASGVANALPQTAATPTAPAGLPLPALLSPAAMAGADTLANASAVQPIPAVGAQNATLDSAALLSPAAPAESATAVVPPAVVLPAVVLPAVALPAVVPPAVVLPIAAANDSAAQTASPAPALPDAVIGESIIPVDAAPFVVTPAATSLPVSSIAPQAGVAITRTAAPAAHASALSTPKSSVAAVTAPTVLPTGTTVPADTTGEEAATSAASKEQNLDGIERLLTLGMGKAANTAAAGSASAAPVPGAVSPDVSGQASANVIVPGAQRNVHASVAAGANAGASVPLAPLPNAPSANVTGTDLPNALAASTTALGSPADAGGAGNPVLMPFGTATRMAEAPPMGVKNSGVGPAPLLTSDVSTPGANALSGLSAASGAQSQSSDAGGEEQQAQSGAHSQSGDSASGDASNSGSGLNGVVNAPTAGAQTAATTGAATAGANAGGQIDRAQIVAQVTRHLEQMRMANGSGEMRLHLTPGHLGNVQISVASHQDGVVARIAVETAQIQQVMDGAKAHLRATLEARGLHVQSVEVTVTPHSPQNNPSAFGQQRSHQSDGEGRWGQTAYGRGASASTAAPIIAPGVTSTTNLLRAANSRLDCQA